MIDRASSSAEDAHEGCFLCANNKPFDLPQSLIDAAHRGDVVVFAGAGVSTEVPAVFPSTVYRDALASLPKEGEGSPESDSFPDVMTAYENKFNRAELLRILWRRFDYVRSFTRLESVATRFQRELATMPYISTIITTNWDTYFEDYAGAIPIVVGEDYAFHSVPERKVYKIHGSINVVSSVVATREDYDKCLSHLRGSALGGTLRHLLATKVIVFVGYSLSDPDFEELYSTLTSDLGRSRPPAYFVGPYEAHGAKNFGLKEILTDGTFFLHQIKESLVKDSHFLADDMYDRIGDVREEYVQAKREMDSLPHTRYPGVLYGRFYLDGILDAFDRILANRRKGEYTDTRRVAAIGRTYDDLYKRATERGRHHDAAYIEGYGNGIYTVLKLDDDPDAPPYFCFTRRGIWDFDDFERAVKNLRRRNRSAWQYAKEISEQVGPDLIPSHTPFLDGLGDVEEGEGL